jgi:hypothetical protein
MGSDWKKFSSTARTDRQIDIVALIYKIAARGAKYEKVNMTCCL